MEDNITTSATDVQNAQSPKQYWRQIGIHTYLRIVILGGLLYWLFHNELNNIVGRWLTDSSWSHGFIIPLFSLYFLNQSKQEILNTRPRTSYIGFLLFIGAILFYIFNTISPAGYGYFRQISTVGALGGAVLYLTGWQLTKYLWLPVVYLFFAVPLPDEILRTATIPMRLWAAAASTAILNLFPNMDATANGVIIDVIYKGVHLEPPLDVAEACSGMRLLMTFFALGVAMAYIHYRPPWQRLILLASTVPIAILCNIVRVTITGFIYVLGDPQYAQGIYHDLLGMAMLPLAFGLYGVLAWFMENLFVENDDDKTPDIVVRKR